jgi:hypothetical protein
MALVWWLLLLRRLQGLRIALVFQTGDHGSLLRLLL